MPEETELLTRDELAARLKINPQTVYSLTRNRTRVRHATPLPTIKVGKYLRFRWSSVLAWLQQLEEAGGQR